MTIQLAFDRDPTTGQVLFNASGYPVFTANTGASTYGDMQTRIADEVLGSPTTAQIKNAIQDAIGTFERQQFWFNDMRYYGGVTGSLSNLQTVAGKEFYSYQDLNTLINMPYIRQIMVLAFNNRYPLVNRSQEWIDDQSVSTTWQGLPTDYCWVGGALRIYPVPNDAYPLIVTGTIRFAPLVDDADFDCWVNEAEPLIRTEAKRNLFTNITRNPAQATAMAQEIYGNPAIGMQGYLAQLRRESTARGGGGGGKIRPSRGYMGPSWQ